MTGLWILLIVLGCIFISLMQVVKRFVLKGNKIKPTQLLKWQMFAAGILYGMLYLIVWGWHMPLLAPRFWLAVFLCSLANVFIQYLNAKAATLEQGEISLTAPLQAMTPGMITLLALTIGELPGWFGWLGIMCMAIGSYYIMWPKQKERWYDWIGPIYRLRMLFHLGELDQVERSRTIAVCLGLGSAAMGTFGLLFESLYVRRAGNVQGIVLGSMSLCFILSAVYATLSAVTARNQVVVPMPTEVRRRFLIGLPILSAMWVGHQLCIQPAFGHLLTSYVGTLKRLSIILSVILGIVLFKEAKNKDQLRNRLWAAVLITTGSILIYWDGITTKLTSTFEEFGF